MDRVTADQQAKSGGRAEALPGQTPPAEGSGGLGEVCGYPRAEIAILCMEETPLQRGAMEKGIGEAGIPHIRPRANASFRY